MPKYVKNSLIKTNYFSYLQNLDHDLRQQQHTNKVQKWSNSISVQSSNCFLLKWFRCQALKFSPATDCVSSATIHEKSDNTERHTVPCSTRAPAPEAAFQGIYALSSVAKLAEERAHACLNYQTMLILSR